MKIVREKVKAFPPAPGQNVAVTHLPSVTGASSNFWKSRKCLENISTYLIQSVPGCCQLCPGAGMGFHFIYEDIERNAISVVPQPVKG